MDVMISGNSRGVFTFLFRLFASLYFIVAGSSPYLLLLFVPLSVFYHSTQKVYRASARELQRLSAWLGLCSSSSLLLAPPRPRVSLHCCPPHCCSPVTPRDYARLRYVSLAPRCTRWARVAGSGQLAQSRGPRAARRISPHYVSSPLASPCLPAARPLLAPCLPPADSISKSPIYSAFNE